MITINTISDIKFSFNGVNYLKNFTPIVVGDKIRILNTYDSKIELTDAPTLFSEFTVNGVTYANVALLQDALLLVIFTRSTLSGGGGIPEAPIDGDLYGRKNSDWEIIPTSGGASTITANTGAVIDLSNPIGNYCNQITASNLRVFSTVNPVVGGWAKVLFNTTNPPDVTGGILENGSKFVAGTDMYLMVYYDGNSVKYFFLQKTPAFINEIVPKQSEYVSLVGDLNFSVAGAASVVTYGTLAGGIWNYIFDFSRNWSFSFSGAQTSLGVPRNTVGLNNVQLLRVSDDSVALNGDFRTNGQTRQFFVVGALNLNSVNNTFEMAQKIEIKCVNGALSLWNNDVLFGNTGVTITENVRLKISLDDYNMYNMKFIYL